MTLYRRDAAERLLAIATKATNIVETDSAHLAQLAETIIALYDRLAAPPRVIRTREELANLDPDTVLATHGLVAALPLEIMWHLNSPPESVLSHDELLPAVVIREGDEYRAAMKALEEA